MSARMMRPRIPQLENGDRLSRDEFERRYHMTPKHIKAELIDGVVYVASPVRAIHATPHADVIEGRIMQVVEMQLVAIALTISNCTVVTKDSDLSAVPGLQVENWATA